MGPPRGDGGGWGLPGAPGCPWGAARPAGLSGGGGMEGTPPGVRGHPPGCGKPPRGMRTPPGDKGPHSGMRDPPRDAGSPAGDAGPPPLRMRDPFPGARDPSRTAGRPPSGCGTPIRDAAPSPGMRDTPWRCGIPPRFGAPGRSGATRDAPTPRPRGCPRGSRSRCRPRSRSRGAVLDRPLLGVGGGGALHRVLAPSQLQRVPSRGCSSLRASPVPPLYRWGAAVPGRSSSGVPKRSLCARVLPPVPPCSLLSEGRARSQKSSANCAGERQFCKVTVVQGGGTHTHKPVPRVAVRSSAVPRGLGTSAGPPCAAGSAVQHPPGLRVSWAGAAAGCHPLRDVTLSKMPPSPGCHPLRDATRSVMPPSAGCHPLQGAARLPPPCPSAAAKLQPSREGSGCSRAQVLLQIFPSCACCTATGRRRLLPAALFLASAAPRLRCCGLLGLLGSPQGGRGPRLGGTSVLVAGGCWREAERLTGLRCSGSVGR